MLGGEGAHKAESEVMGERGRGVYRSMSCLNRASLAFGQVRLDLSVAVSFDFRRRFDRWT